MSVTLLLSVILTLAQDPQLPIKPGMKMADVRRLLPASEPKQVSRQILYRRYLEQWLCDKPEPLLIEFECVRGQAAKVLSASKPKPK